MSKYKNISPVAFNFAIAAYTKGTTMFDELDAIPWTDLTHAYGSAEEVPTWLRQLIFSDVDTRESAMNRLYGSLCHQGWISPATAYAVPCLLELLQEPGIQVKEDILKLLKHIARADSDLQEKTWRKNVYVPSWNVPASIPFKDARLEVLKGIPIYLTFLEETANPNVRMQAGNLLREIATLPPDIQARLDIIEQ